MKSDAKTKSFFPDQKIGLALGSGAARGLSHIGVLKSIQKEGIPISMIAGTSIGALVGACYAKNEDIAELENIVLETDWKKMAGLIDLNVMLTKKGFLRGEKVKALLKTVIGDVEFKDLKIPLAVVATDIHTGEEVVIKEGSVVEAVRASVSIPVTFVPVKRGDRFLFDGGIVNPVPVNIAKEMGATYVIACDVSRAAHKTTPGKGEQSPSKSSSRKKIFNRLDDEINSFISENKQFRDLQMQFFDRIDKLLPELKEIDPRTPTIFYALTQALYSMQARIVQQYLDQADMVIRPETEDIDTYDFHRGAEVIERGVEAAQKAFSENSFETI